MTSEQAKLVEYYYWEEGKDTSTCIREISLLKSKWRCILSENITFDIPNSLQEVLLRQDIGVIVVNKGVKIAFLKEDILPTLVSMTGNRSYDSFVECILLNTKHERRLGAVELNFELLVNKVNSATRNQEKRVLFFSPYGAWVGHAQLEAVLASALNARNISTMIVRCDGVFKKNCYATTHSKDQENDCKICQEKGGHLFQFFGLPIVQIRKYIEPNDWEIAYKWVDSLSLEEYRSANYEGMQIGHRITPIVCSYHMISQRHLNLPEVQETHRLYLVYSLVSYFAMQRLFDEFRPTNAVICQGGGMIQESVMELCKQRNIQVLAHSNGRNPGSFIFTVNEITSAFASRFEIAQVWKDVPLDQEEFTKVSNYIRERQQGINHNFITFYNFKTEEAAVRKQLNIPVDAKIFAAFTSAEYEKIYFKEYDELPSQIEILRRLINVFRHRSEYLVIRHHPNIGGGESMMADKDFISEIYRMSNDLPSNVRIVMPHEELTSYALLWNTEACISFFSTVGLEAVAAGVPTAICEESLYSPGATHLLKNLSEESLSRTVEQLLAYREQFNVNDLRRLYRFLNAFIFKHSTVLKSCLATSNGQADVRIRSQEELLPGVDQGLDKIINHILHGTSVLDYPSKMDYSRSISLEEDLLRGEFAEITQRRIELLQKVSSDLGCQSIKDPPVEALVVLNNQDTNSSAEYVLPKQRIACERITLVNSSNSWLNLAKTLREALTSVGPEIVWIVSPNCKYDEHFLYESCHKLMAIPEMAGVLTAAWISRDNGEIGGSIFTALDRPYSFDVFKTLIALEQNPLNIFHLCILKRQVALALLDHLLNSPDPKHGIREIFEIFISKHVIQNISPALWYTPNIYKNSIDLSFEAQGRKFAFGVSSKAIITGLEEEVKSPANATRIIELSIDYLNRGMFVDASRLLDVAVRNDPASPDLKFIKAYALSKHGELQGAERTLLELLSSHPSHQQAVELLNEIKSR
jgi:hypothetical protein